LTKAPYDLADHIQRHGNYFTNGQILESTRVMDRGTDARQRRDNYHWTHKRQNREDKTTEAQSAKTEKEATGAAHRKKKRFLKVTGAAKQLDQATIDRARQLAGLKGYATTLPIEMMSGDGVIAAYHDLWRVEASFGDDQIRPARPAGVPPPARVHRSPLDRG